MTLSTKRVATLIHSYLGESENERERTTDGSDLHLDQLHDEFNAPPLSM